MHHSIDNPHVLTYELHKHFLENEYQEKFEKEFVLVVQKVLAR